MILTGDCVELMATLDADSVDAIVTDPPYGLEFMGKEWDSFATVRRKDELTPSGEGHSTSAGPYLAHSVNKYVAGAPMQAFHYEWAREAFRVAKPGAHLLAFGGTRTYHRLASAIEDAGWEIRDCLVWAYASGFPKSLDVSKAIDKARTEDREAIESVAAFLRDALTTSGIKQEEFERLAGLGYNSACNFTQPNRKSFGVPRWVLWGTFKTILNFGDSMDAEVWRLNGRKGKPGDNWELRPVTGDAGPLWESWERNAGLEGKARSGERRDEPATDAAKRWSGWGTALKPAWEPIVMARKPLVGTVAANVLAYGTGALNIDGTRIAGAAGNGVWGSSNETANPTFNASPTKHEYRSEQNAAGRWPANLILTDPLFDGGVDGVVGGGTQSDNDTGPRIAVRGGHKFGGDKGQNDTLPGLWHGDTGTYSRFFLIPKAARSDREPVLRGQVAEIAPVGGGPSGALACAECGRLISGQEWQTGELSCGHPREAAYRPKPNAPRANAHPTVKPVELMRHLVRLVTPPGGTVLDCFLGSGTTAIAAELEGFAWIGIEKEAEYVAIAEARLNGTQRGLGL